jgi:tetratricopeptide (TPR) repeat protein
MPEQSLALCAIAGNVDSFIERFVTSFQKLTPHLYIVQAVGSQVPDRTLEIARRLGAKVGIYQNSEAHRDWPHVDDFAAARNLSFNMARADGHTHLMWADTDDVIDEASAAILSEAVKTREFDLLYAPYRLSNNGLAPFRERIGRADRVEWRGAIHEHLHPLVENHVRADEPQAFVTHLPSPHRSDNPNARNIRVLESQPETPSRNFYLCQEYDAAGRLDEAVATAVRALEAWQKDRSTLQTCEAYELYILLARWAPENETKLQLLREAWGLEPWRREALAYLTAAYLDLARGQEALAVARMMLSLPAPALQPWTHRASLYGWAGLHLYTAALRLNGAVKEADELEIEHFRKSGRKISVLHPVRGRPMKSLLVRKQFLERARAAASVEYIFAFSEDDHEAQAILGRFRHVLTPAGHLGDVGGTYVRNMNAAFAASDAPVIVGSADDIEPPLWWDEQVLTQLGDPARPAVLGVRDGIRQDGLLITQIFTRPTPQTLGLPYGEFLSGEYRGVYSDTEFSFRAQKAGIVKPTTLTFLHHHPITGRVPSDDTYSIMNSPGAYEYGKAVFERRNPDATTA